MNRLLTIANALPNQNIDIIATLQNILNTMTGWIIAVTAAFAIFQLARHGFAFLNGEPQEQEQEKKAMIRVVAISILIMISPGIINQVLSMISGG